MTVGEAIRKYRKEKGFTQVQLSKMCGISQQHISDIEKGKCIPNWNTLLTICKNLSLVIKVTEADHE